MDKIARLVIDVTDKDWFATEKMATLLIDFDNVNRKLKSTRKHSV